MNGINEAVETLMKLTDDRRKPSTQMIAGGNDLIKKFEMVDGEGVFLPELSSRSDHVFQCQSVAGLIDMVNDYTKRFPEHKVRIGVGLSRITLWFSIDDCCHLAYYDLVKNTGFSWLERAFSDAGNELDQDELDWLIRSKFSGKVNPLGFHPAIKALKFKSGSTGSRNISQGAETVDLEIESEIVGVNQGDLCEEIAISTAVFDDQFLSSSDIDVKVAVRINLAEKTFTLLPLDGEISKAYASATGLMADHIETACLGNVVAVAGLDLFGKTPTRR